MPSKTLKQKRTMAAIAHGWKPPASSDIDIPVSVAKEYNAADTAKHLANALRAKKGRSK